MYVFGGMFTDIPCNLYLQFILLKLPLPDKNVSVAVRISVHELPPESFGLFVLLIMDSVKSLCQVLSVLCISTRQVSALLVALVILSLVALLVLVYVPVRSLPAPETRSLALIVSLHPPVAAISRAPVPDGKRTEIAINKTNRILLNIISGFAVMTGCSDKINQTDNMDQSESVIVTILVSEATAPAPTVADSLYVIVLLPSAIVLIAVTRSDAPVEFRDT